MFATRCIFRLRTRSLCAGRLKVAYPFCHSKGEALHITFAQEKLIEGALRPQPVNPPYLRSFTNNKTWGPQVNLTQISIKIEQVQCT